MKAPYLDGYWYIPERFPPPPEAIEKLRAVIRDLRGKGLLATDQPGTCTDDEAVQQMGFAYAEFRHLTDALAGRESRAATREHLVKLKGALEGLASASEALRLLIGTPSYSAMPLSVLRLLEGAHTTKWGVPSREMSSEDVDDPLWWDGYDQGGGLQKSGDWAQLMIPIVSDALSTFKVRGAPSGRPAAIFVDRALAVWRALDASEQTGRIPTTGTLATWFDAAFKLVGEPLKQEPDVAAKKAHAKLARDARAAAS